MNNLAVTTPITGSLLKGFLDLEETECGLLPHRLPAWARAQYPVPQLGFVEAETSGVRLKFRSSATAIELDVLPTRRELVGVPSRPKGVFDLCIDGQLQSQQTAESATLLRTDLSTGTTRRVPGIAETLRFANLPEGEKLVEIWLPHNEIVELATMRSDASIKPDTDAGQPVWLHHGSSISQGSNAASPTGIWPVVASRMENFDLVNLGFGGNALLDPFVARTMRDTSADLVSVKIGINLVNADLMRLRAFVPAVHGFLDTIRDGHPETPLLVISPIFCPIHENTPGPGTFDLKALAKGEIRFEATGRPDEVNAGKLTLSVIREHLKAIVEQRRTSDRNIHYLDGLALYGEHDHSMLPLPDQLHPETKAHLLIGQRFAARLKRRWQ
ncbi:SGNH/GDSL hydrolase family protein [Martelella sp. FOR1707]